MKIAFIFHTEKNFGDHGAECREVILFDHNDKVSDLLAFISHRGGALELVRQVEPLTADAIVPKQDAALEYVADNTYCGADGEWHFKRGYNPQVVLDAIARARGEP